MSDSTPLMPPPPPRRWLRFAMMGITFVCGAVVGAVVSRIATQHQMMAAIKNPEQVPDRIMPRLVSILQLTPEQSEHVGQIVRTRHHNMETIRSQGYPEMVAEFSAMREEISMVLTPEQQDRWQSMSHMIEMRFLPSPPQAHGPRTVDP